jgi:peptidoglycan/LPS O-acetylase OafA/YrhL
MIGDWSECKLSTAHDAPSEVKPRLYLIDCLRGLAALVVVVFHWKHFVLISGLASSDASDILPLYGALSLIYKYGDNAVGLFFCISGFTFSWLYADRLHNNTLDFKTFFISRFARLYPLHICTLVTVFLLQLPIVQSTGTYFVYPHNDIRHLVLQLFLASNWGLEDGFSFNGPIWSVSVEVLLYSIFYIVFKNKLGRITNIGVLVCVALCITFFAKLSVNVPLYLLGSGIVCFFSGVVTCWIFRFISTKRISLARVGFIFLCVLSVIYLAYNTNETELYNAIKITAQLIDAGPTVFNVCYVLASCLRNLLTFYLPISIVVLLAVLAEPLCKSKFAVFDKLGQMSYSLYLWHFPLQLILVNLILYTKTSSLLMFNVWVFCAYLLTLIYLSHLSYTYIEKPSKLLITRLFSSRTCKG